MKKSIFILLFLLSALSFNLSAQKSGSGEQYGKTLNLGLGIGGYSGYYSYAGHTMPVFHIDYEFDVAKDFTLAPFISFYSYRNKYYWGDNQHPNKHYYFRETVIPIGLKGTYYFDEIFSADSKWDFYLAGSLGFAIVNASWDDDYYGDRDYYRHASPLFLDLHAGAEYHLNKRLGLYLDISTGVSTIGLAIH